MTVDEHGRPQRWMQTIFFAFVVIVGLYAVFVWFLTPLRDAARQASGANDLKDAQLCVWRYAAEHNDELPSLDPEPGRLMFARAEMFPEYCDDPSLITCEFDFSGPASQRELRGVEYRDPQYIDDHSMFYLGYVLENEEQGIAFVNAYKAQVRAGGDLSSNLDARAGSGSFGSDQFVRLTTDAELLSSLLDDSGQGDVSVDQLKASIAVFIERPEHYDQPGGWVAYLDGHVKWHNYPGEWPMTKRFIEALESLDRLGP